MATDFPDAAIGKFLRIFQGGFADPGYYRYERVYKWNAHVLWKKTLNKKLFTQLLTAKQYAEICKRALRVDAQTKFMLASSQKMALSDAVKGAKGAKDFAGGLYELVYGRGDYEGRFNAFAEVLQGLPKRKSPVFAWPIQTIFPFLASPKEHIFLKPEVTQKAGEHWGVELSYSPRPNWSTYSRLLKLADVLWQHLAYLNPTDMIDIQSFIWITEFYGYKGPPLPDIGQELAATAAKADEDGDFSPGDLQDERERRLRTIVQRRGQPEFRRKLIAAYGGRCAITGFDAFDALEAAHISPYSGPASNIVSNGLLLRCDVHTLFDLDLIGIEPDRLEVHIAPSLKKTCYAELSGRRIKTPSNPTTALCEKALRQRWLRFRDAD
jgi:hypothetical protein